MNLNYGENYDPTKGWIEPDSYNPQNLAPEQVEAGYRLMKTGEPIYAREYYSPSPGWCHWFADGKAGEIGSRHCCWRRPLEPEYLKPVFPTSLPGFKYKIEEEVTLCYPGAPFIIGTKVKITGFVKAPIPNYAVKRIDDQRIDDYGWHYVFEEKWLSKIIPELTETINSRQVIARKDGSLTVGCTTLGKEEVDKIIALRNQAIG